MIMGKKLSYLFLFGLAVFGLGSVSQLQGASDIIAKANKDIAQHEAAMQSSEQGSDTGDSELTDGVVDPSPEPVTADDPNEPAMD